jgi:hypothetical protein
MVVRTLNEACEAEAGSKRNQILADLVGNLSAPIEGHVIAYFLRDASIRDGQVRKPNQRFFWLSLCV